MRSLKEAGLMSTRPWVPMGRRGLEVNGNGFAGLGTW